MALGRIVKYLGTQGMFPLLLSVEDHSTRRESRILEENSLLYMWSHQEGFGFLEEEEMRERWQKMGCMSQNWENIFSKAKEKIKCKNNTQSGNQHPVKKS